MNFLGPYKYVLDAIVIAVLVAFAAIGVHKYNVMQQDIGEARVQAAWNIQKLADSQALIATEHQFTKEKDDAILQASKSTQVATAATAAAVQSSRVFDSTIKAVLARSATDSVDANRKYTTTLGELLGACKEEYRSMGREAQGHYIDSLMYQQAWPVAKP
jgi:hypothetical protein